ncbi:ABC transporter G family member 31 isoform X2 [Spinacia oleracea]|uniref:ABC transporter G family member 31 isoform X2 n=1 Tax=Spinacia oleracea TaxID=3562 RepID=A0ABM3QW69_SPIOL|nr:ABC transporter G family member 31-like isoform X2 [Spinacia oleracea]
MAEYIELDINELESPFPQPSNAETVAKDEDDLVWAAIERLPSFKQLNFALLRDDGEAQVSTIDVTKLDRNQRELVVQKALDTPEQDNYKLVSGIRQRFQRVELELPKVEVRFEDLNITAEVQIGRRALPTLINFTRDKIEGILKLLRISRPQRHTLTILNNVSGFLKPGRMTLLLGPPGSGKSTLLLALAGKLDSSLKKSGNVTYNGHQLSEFCAQRTSAYISQTDNHIAELTVRETFDFAARCQGASDSFSGYMKELIRLEKETKIHPSPEIDAYMKALSVGGKKHSISTDYLLKVLGLDICADTVVGDDMNRGVSGGQRKRVTSGELIVGPKKTLLMDEISTGLDSSTTFQIVKCIGNFVHQMEGTVLMALLQPAPETFELFDDLMLLSEGHMVYHGPRIDVLDFFESLGFRLPPRKGVADFLQEVTSRKDQEQYWADPSKPYRFISAEQIAEAFRNSRFGKMVTYTLSEPYDKKRSHPLALSKTMFALPKWELFKACFSREVLLMRRQSFLYVFRTVQVILVGFITGTTFLKTRLQTTDVAYGNIYLACLFYGITHMMFNGFSELALMIFRLPVFYKQRDNCFYPAWAWSLSSWVLRVPYSAIESIAWSCVVYYMVGFAPGAGSFFCFMLLLFVIHQMALGLFRMVATLARDIVIANICSTASLLVILCMCGFIIPKAMIKPWWTWAYWVSPLSYAQTAISVNEFSATRWMKALGNTTVGQDVLELHAIPTDGRWYWIGIIALLAYVFLFNSIVTLALAYLNPIKKTQTVISVDVSDEVAVDEGRDEVSTLNGASNNTGKKKGMILPFQPLSMTFHNVNYFVDMPKAMKAKGVLEKKLQLLSNVSGVFSPGVLTALVGESGAGKTTMMDVLAGRKTGGYIEGDIRISGYPKVQHTFARISGYIEQNDIHSPQVTVEESLWFSCSLRLSKEISKETKKEFVDEVMRLVELDNLKHALVGLPGTTGLSTEQRKRLTIGVELVANPSIIFMDEPTSGLDARAAAIVMRTVRNTVDTGRTVVCTIHQPSIDIFEAFDELLLMKRGGQVIYGGKLGVHSCIMIDYFQGIDGIPRIPDGYNPATWMLEITAPAIEERLGKDFTSIYRNSSQFREVEALIKQKSKPLPGSEPLRFDTTFSQHIISQFWLCLKKQFVVYWRSPQYNAVRFLFTTFCALVLGSIFWDVGSKRDSIINLMTIMGALHSACLFLGVSNASSVQPVVSTERTVFYREKAAGMYSPLAYAAAQALVEVPYIAAQTLTYGIITYFMIGFERTLRKFVLYLLFTFLTFTYFTFYGMMCVGITPTQSVSAVISSSFYSLWNLYSGFLIPRRFIPGWWIWFYYICPVAWTLRGIISSQLGDVESIIVGDGFQGSVKEYLDVHYGYGPGMIGVSAITLLGFTLLFAGAFVTSIRFLNFQRR